MMFSKNSHYSSLQTLEVDFQSNRFNVYLAEVALEAHPGSTVDIEREPLGGDCHLSCQLGIHECLGSVQCGNRWYSGPQCEPRLLLSPHTSAVPAERLLGQALPPLPSQKSTGS